MMDAVASRPTRANSSQWLMRSRSGKRKENCDGRDTARATSGRLAGAWLAVGVLFTISTKVQRTCGAGSALNNSEATIRPNHCWM